MRRERCLVSLAPEPLRSRRRYVDHTTKGSVVEQLYFVSSTTLAEPLSCFYFVLMSETLGEALDSRMTRTPLPAI
jgi:hypothetical protein